MRRYDVKMGTTLIHSFGVKNCWMIPARFVPRCVLLISMEISMIWLAFDWRLMRLILDSHGFPRFSGLKIHHHMAIHGVTSAAPEHSTWYGRRTGFSAWVSPRSVHPGPVPWQLSLASPHRHENYKVWDAKHHFENKDGMCKMCKMCKETMAVSGESRLGASLK